ncbi:HNH endonuclease family protein [Amycolatopsis sp. TNS106]|uniref:HNH endonuclease family protein n=1 Tax=Amycolatopsis sp. TNS106 TaxID=2861750 RepID=UPI002105E11D|nr:HNH endonuclease family protein [Amycolatopsis sp. TNS106]
MPAATGAQPAPLSMSVTVPGDAGQQLAALQVAPRGSMDGYDRKKFPHWDDHGSSCNTREVVLKRDGKNVVTGPDCAPVSGTWPSPYDGETWTKATDVDVDHMVPLAAAWVSGAKSWTTEKRRQFANDLTRPQLLAVTDNVNQEKSDRSPDQWKPPLVSYRCTYATAWTAVKHFYGLSVTAAEKTALGDMLKRCRR